MLIKKGTSIIEIVIAAALISVAIIAALSLANQSQKQNSYARDLAEATKYATQAGDWIRNERNSLGWTALSELDAGEYCLNDFPADFTLIEPGSCNPNAYISGTRYSRQISLTKDPDKLTIKIVVSWIEQVQRQATIEMELQPWH